MLTRLKKFLKDQNLDYFLLPNSDEFFSEYLQDSEKRVEALTGFTGSNATVIFGQEKSYFFTDGRYTLQAKSQLDLDEFEIFNIAEKPVMAWVRDNIDSTKKLAVDAKLTNINFVRALPDLVILDSSPVILDKARDPVNKSQIFSLSEKITGANSLTKRAKVLQDFKADAILITKPENICWLLNIRAQDLEFTPLLLVYAILFKNGEVDLFTSEQKTLELEKVNFVQSNCLDLRLSSLSKKIKKIQIDENTTNYWLYDLLRKNNFEVTHKTDPVELLKSQKNPTEIFGAIKAHEIDGLAVTKFLFWLKKVPGTFLEDDEISEISAARKLLDFRKESSSFFSESFPAISGFASNSAVIHYYSTEKTNKKICYPALVAGSTLSQELDQNKNAAITSRWTPQQVRGDRTGVRGDRTGVRGDSVGVSSDSVGVLGDGVGARNDAVKVRDNDIEKSGELYLIDSGGQYLADGTKEDFCGTTDITRTVAIGTPTAEMKENFTRVLKGHIALARAKFPRGTSGAQLDVLAREHLWHAGLNYDHGTGHGVGSFLSVHEGPCGISKNAYQSLLPGMILSNEPGFYKENEYGIRIENLMLVTESEKNFLQFKTLTLAPIDPDLIDFKMLTRPEKKWLYNYHAEILEKFSHQLESEILSWLESILQNFKE